MELEMPSDCFTIEDAVDAAPSIKQCNQEDVKLLKDMGMDAYKFSISWSRIFIFSTDGTKKTLNETGLMYYSKLIDMLVNARIEPYVTLYHWDLPEALEKKNGWLNESIVQNFADYAEACFKNFTKVKNWITFNDPYSFITQGYATGKFPPKRCPIPKCTKGGSRDEPYLAARNVLLSHAAAVKVYREKYQKKIQGGKIGIALKLDWREPYSDEPADIAAAERMIEFELGWFLHPIIYGDYPTTMKNKVNLTPLINYSGSIDFVGLNYFNTTYVKDKETQKTKTKSSCGYYEDVGAQQIKHITPHKEPIGSKKAVEYVIKRYENLKIIITGNGIGLKEDTSKGQPNDHERVQYYKEYLLSLSDIKNANILGYFAWSLLDSWEWTEGLSVKFGLYYVDKKHERHPKASAKWFNNTFLPRRGVC